MNKTSPNFADGTVLKRFSLLLMTVVWTGWTALNPAFAQGTVFTYQGRLNDGADPANGSYDLRFALYDALTVGNQAGSPLTNSPVNVSNGFFTVTLDFGNQFPGADRWLEIGVRTNGGGAFTSLNPRQPLTAAPYSIYAGSAATLATTNSQPLIFTINGTEVLRIALVSDTVNWVGGYSGNIISNNAEGAFIGGGGALGYPNRVAGDYASVLGGLNNSASGAFSVAMGRSATTRGFISTAMGDNTLASGNTSTALGGFTTAAGTYSTAMGLSSTATNYAATAMGFETTAAGSYSTAMGRQTTASGSDATAIGNSTIASGTASTAMGYQTTASYDYSMALGYRAVARQNGTFVWADSTDVAFDPFGLLGPQGIANSFNVRSTGGFYIASAVNPTSGQILSGVQVAAGGGSWSSLSDRNAKTNFSAVDPRAVLEKLVRIPVETWNYKAQAASIRHIGPMAQDFAAAFAVGDDDTHITTVDADGVALAAIQGLNEKVEVRSQKSEDRSRELEARLEQKETEITELKKRLETIEKFLRNQKSN